MPQRQHTPEGQGGPSHAMLILSSSGPGTPAHTSRDTPEHRADGVGDEDTLDVAADLPDEASEATRSTRSNLSGGHGQPQPYAPGGRGYARPSVPHGHGVAGERDDGGKEVLDGESLPTGTQRERDELTGAPSNGFALAERSDRGERLPVRAEARGEVGPLIDELHVLFDQDRTTASQGGTTRCGICYLHFVLADLEYRDGEGYYVCRACARSLGSMQLPMVRRQQRT